MLSHLIETGDGVAVVADGTPCKMVERGCVADGWIFSKSAAEDCWKYSGLGTSIRLVGALGLCVTGANSGIHCEDKLGSAIDDWNHATGDWVNSPTEASTDVDRIPGIKRGLKLSRMVVVVVVSPSKRRLDGAATGVAEVSKLTKTARVDS